MWASFFADFALLIFMLYVPGSLFGSAFRMPKVLRFSFAPIFSITAYEALAIAYQKASVSASFVKIVLPVMVLSILVCVASRLVGRAKSANCEVAQNATYRASLLALYACVGLFVGAFFFVRQIDGANTFLQAWDNGFHLNAIRSFIDTGNFSALAVTARIGVESNPTFVYYPAAFHMLVALVVEVTGSTVPVCINAVNFVFASVVFPLGMYCFLERSLGFNRIAVLAGAFVSSSFVSFPWTFLVYGPLFPNLASMALMPAALVIAMDLFDSRTPAKERVRLCVLLLISVVAFGLTQPNSFFAAIVILLPFAFVEFRAYASVRGLRIANMSKRSYYMLCAGLMFGLWAVFYVLPPLHAPYTMNWASFATAVQAVANVLFVGYIRPQADLVLALLVLIGFVGAIRRKKCGWMCVSYVILCVMLIVGESTDGFVKRFLTGLWYTDQFRIAAMVGIAATPLACLGAAWGLETIKGWHDRLAQVFGSVFCFETVRNVMVVSGVILLFVPCFSIPGIVDFNTPFGAFKNEVAQSYSATAPNVLDSAEREFIQEAAEVTSQDKAVVINQAYDGSVYAYGLSGLNTYYRSYGDVPCESEDEDSRTIRLHMNELATNPSVQKSVDNIGAKYLLVLDYGKGETGEGCLHYYVKDYWVGINAVTDETPGFEIVLAKDDMRLYRLNY